MRKGVHYFDKNDQYTSTVKGNGKELGRNTWDIGKVLFLKVGS